MARPRIYDEDRVATAIRLPVSVHAELRRLARARDVSVNYLINRAVDELLAHSAGPEEDAALFSRSTSMGRSA
jgi:predicted transcriptional regulator